jgi:hypothetical protein
LSVANHDVVPVFKVSPPMRYDLYQRYISFRHVCGEANCSSQKREEIMEAALLLRSQQRDSAKTTTPEIRLAAGTQALSIAQALQNLHDAVQAALPVLNRARDDKENGDSIDTEAGGFATETDSVVAVSASWLLQLCSSVASEYLEPWQLARAIVEASQLDHEQQQEAALFDVLGASESAMDVLMQVAPKLSEIRQRIHLDDLTPPAHYGDSSMDAAFAGSSSSSSTLIDIEEERRQFLLREAMDAAQVAAVAQAEVDAVLGVHVGGGVGTSATNHAAVSTHTIVRSSERQLIKLAEKAAKRAAVALQRAKDAGAILDETNLLSLDAAATSLGPGGLLHRTHDEMGYLQQSLLPDGSRQYYDQRGLPKGAIREKIGDMDRVVIPAAKLDDLHLPQRLRIRDVITDPTIARAFDGTDSLNPMQSSTFQVAYHTRDNMMVCAPVCPVHETYTYFHWHKSLTLAA